LKPGRKDPKRVHKYIRKRGQNNDEDQPRDYGANASKNVARLIRQI